MGDLHWIHIGFVYKEMQCKNAFFHIDLVHLRNNRGSWFEWFYDVPDSLVVADWNFAKREILMEC